MMVNWSLTDYIFSAMFIISLSVFIQKPAPRYLKYYPIYFLGQVLIGFYQEYTARHSITNTTEVNVYAILDFSFLFFVLRDIISSSKGKRIILFISSGYFVFAFVNIFLIQKKVGFNPVNFTVACFITVAYCVYYYFELFQKTETQSLVKLPSFWIVSAIFFNIVLTFPLFALQGFMSHVSSLIARNISLIFNIVIILSFILYSIGFLCRIQIRRSYL
jgi:hypothetical protein